MGSSTGDLLVDDERQLDHIFGDGERLIAVHAEDESRIRSRTNTMLNGVKILTMRSIQKLETPKQRLSRPSERWR